MQLVTRHSSFVSRHSLAQPAFVISSFLALAALLCAVPQSAQATGKIRTVDVYDPDGLHSFPNADSALTVGDKVRVRFRMVNVHWANTVADSSYTNPWEFMYTGSLTGNVDIDELLRQLANKPRLGLWISGRVREAECVNWPMGIASDWLTDWLDGEQHYTDLIFEYTVQAGDIALPVQLANASGTGPVSASDPGPYYLKCNGLDTLWKIVDQRTHSVTADFAFGPLNLYDDPDFAGEDLAKWGRVNTPTCENRDFDLSGEGVYVQALDFDPTYCDADAGIWRKIAPGSTTADPGVPALAFPGGAARPMDLYLWTERDTVAEVVAGGQVTEVAEYRFADGVTRKVGTVHINRGDESVPFSIKATGDIGAATKVFLAATPTNIYNAAHDIVTNFISRTVQVALWATDFAAGDIRLTDYSGTYDGRAHTIGVTTANTIDGLTLRYCAVTAAEAQSLNTNHLPLTTDKPEFTNVCDMVVFVEASAPGYFTTTNSATVTITPRPVTFSGKSETKSYTGSEIEIKGIVVSNLVAGHTHDFSFSAKGTEVGLYAGAVKSPDSIVIKSGEENVTANYAVNVSGGSLTIKQDPALALAVSLAGASFAYNGQPHTLPVPATHNARGGETAVEYSRDQSSWTTDLQSLSATDVADSCTIHVRATNPNYANVASNTAALTIEPLDLSAALTIGPLDRSGATMATIGTFTYAGTSLTPAVSVTCGGLRPAAGVDYDITYADNEGPGTATITLTGKGNYTGRARTTFEIVAPPTPSPTPEPTPPKPTPTPKPTTYTVKFSASGGALPKGESMAAQKMARDKAYKLRANKFARDGYVFLGWSKRKNGPVAYKNAQKVKNLAKAGKSVTLYAAWAKAQYKVVFDASGGRGKMAAQTFTYGESQKLRKNQFTRKGYVFGGWAIRDPLATVGKVAYKDGQKVKNLSRNGGTVKLYAVWKKR